MVNGGIYGSKSSLILESTFNHYISLLAHWESFKESINWNIVSGSNEDEGGWIDKGQMKEETIGCINEYGLHHGNERISKG